MATIAGTCGGVSAACVGISKMIFIVDLFTLAMVLFEFAGGSQSKFHPCPGGSVGLGQNRVDPILQIFSDGAIYGSWCAFTVIRL